MTEPEPEARLRAAALLNELAELRAFAVPPHGAAPDAVHEALRGDLRPRLDRAEALFTEIAGLAARARRNARRLSAEADDAYDEVLGKLAARAVTREYESIRDREVTARLQSSPARKAARAAEREAEVMEQAERAARQLFFGLRDIRAELLASLEKYLPWRASMEF